MLKELVITKVLKIKQDQITKLLKYYTLIQQIINGELIGDVKLRLTALINKSLNRLFKNISLSMGSKSLNEEKLQEAVNIMANTYNNYKDPPNYNDLMAIYKTLTEA